MFQATEQLLAVLQFKLEKEALKDVPFNDCYLLPLNFTLVVGGLGIPLLVKIYPRGLKRPEGEADLT